MESAQGQLSRANSLRGVPQNQALLKSDGKSKTWSLTPTANSGSTQGVSSQSSVPLDLLLPWIEKYETLYAVVWNIPSRVTSYLPNS